jgi:nicotinamidase-related amidase
MKPALLIVDVQKAFFDNPVQAQSLNDAIVYINAAIDLFREKKLPIVCIQQINRYDQLVPGTAGFELPESLKILPADISMHKSYGNAFNKTDLYAKLHELGVDTVIVCGFCAEYCVLNTVRGARDLDLKAMLLRGAIASGKPENIPFVESINELISFGALKSVLA